MKFNTATVTKMAVPAVTQTLIVCGDCMGHELFPRKTFLTSAFTCSRCAGRNYALASTLIPALVGHLKRENLSNDNSLS